MVGSKYRLKLHNYSVYMVYLQVNFCKWAFKISSYTHLYLHVSMSKVYFQIAVLFSVYGLIAKLVSRTNQFIHPPVPVCKYICIFESQLL